MEVFGFNCYDEGYENALKDVEEGKSKDYTGFPKAKAFLSDKAYDTYADGYNKGYSDGLAKKNDIYNNNKQ